jgi:hypothetical protein
MINGEKIGIKKCAIPAPTPMLQRKLKNLEK